MFYLMDNNVANFIVSADQCLLWLTYSFKYIVRPIHFINMLTFPILDSVLKAFVMCCWYQFQSS